MFVEWCLELPKQQTLASFTVSGHGAAVLGSVWPALVILAIHF
jgi:hypothetical protein